MVTTQPSPKRVRSILSASDGGDSGRLGRKNLYWSLGFGELRVARAGSGWFPPGSHASRCRNDAGLGKD
jgi:hypothetical protein